MSTEQERELAAVAEAIGEVMDRYLHWTVEADFAIRSQYIAEMAPSVLAAVNTVRAEQASAGDREAVERLMNIAWLCGEAVERGAPHADQDDLTPAKRVVLARMQRPVIDPETWERLRHDLREGFKVAMQLDPRMTPPSKKKAVRAEFDAVVAGIEAALREDGEA